MPGYGYVAEPGLTGLRVVAYHGGDGGQQRVRVGVALQQAVLRGHGGGGGRHSAAGDGHAAAAGRGGQVAHVEVHIGEVAVHRQRGMQHGRAGQQLWGPRQGVDGPAIRQEPGD